MKKHVKYSNEEEEPEQNLRREIKRDTYDLSYRGRNGKYDWVVDYNYGKRTENDIGILSLAKSTQYTGYNMLPGTALISPEGKSYVHDYKFNRDASGNVYWDEAYEYRGTADLDNYKEVQASDMLKPNNHITVIDKATGAEIADPLTTLGAGMVYYAYKFGDNPTMPYLARINGFGYKEEYNARQNTLTIGKAQIQKWHAYLMDTWQYDKDTIFTPIVRLDHSTLFGSHVAAILTAASRRMWGRGMRNRAWASFTTTGRCILR